MAAFKFVLSVLMALCASTNAHLEFFCVSSIFTNDTAHCNKAVIWLGTYKHQNINRQLPIPGKAIVYRGASPVTDEPFTFDKYCANSTSSRAPFVEDAIGTLDDPPTVQDIEDFIKTLTADDCLPGMEDVLAQIGPSMDVTCYANDTDVALGPDEIARCPSGNRELFALIPILLDSVDSSQDVRVLVHSASVDLERYPAFNGACDVTSITQIDEDNATCYMNIENWDGVTCGEEIPNTISSSEFFSIPGCGPACGPFTPSSAVTNNNCTAALVPSGTTCNIECAGGEIAVGSPVSCQAGAYIGDMHCTTLPAAWIQTARDNATAIDPTSGLENIATLTGPGCGPRTLVGTECFITCAFGFYSTGTLTAVDDGGDLGWVPSPDAACIATSCGTGAASVDSTSPTVVDGDEVPIVGQDSYLDITGGNVVVHQSGCNFDPANDKIIIIPRTEATEGVCGGTLPIGGMILDCDGTGSSATMLVCGTDQSLDPALLPAYGHICVCDADFERGCQNPSQFSKSGRITDVTEAPTLAPTDAPTASPTAAPIAARVSDCGDADGKSGKKGKSGEDDDCEGEDRVDDVAKSGKGKKGKSDDALDRDSGSAEDRVGDSGKSAKAKKGKSEDAADRDSESGSGEDRVGGSAKSAKAKKGKTEDEGDAIDRESGSGSAVDRVDGDEDGKSAKSAKSAKTADDASDRVDGDTAKTAKKGKTDDEDAIGRDSESGEAKLDADTTAAPKSKAKTKKSKSDVLQTSRFSEDAKGKALPMWVPAVGIAAVVCGVVVLAIRSRKRDYARMQNNGADERTPLVATTVVE